MQFRIVPVSLLDRRLEIVDHQRARHAAPVPKRIFESRQQIVGALPETRLAVRLARKTQAQPQHMRPPPLPSAIEDRRSRAEVGLCLRAWLAFHAAKRQLAACAQSCDHALYGAVRAAKVVFGF